MAKRAKRSSRRITKRARRAPARRSKRVTRKAPASKRITKKAPKVAVKAVKAKEQCVGDHYGLTIASVVSIVGIAFIVWMVFSLM